MAPHPSKWSYIFHMYSSENNAPRSQDYSARFHRDMSIMRVLKSRPPRPQPCLPNSQSAVPQSKNFKIHKMGTYSWNPILPDVEFNARITTRKTWKFYDLDSTWSRFPGNQCSDLGQTPYSWLTAPVSMIRKLDEQPNAQWETFNIHTNLSMLMKASDMSKKKKTLHRKT